MEPKINEKAFAVKQKKPMIYYDKRLIAKVVKALEEGTPRKEILATYGMHETTLGLWMSRYGSAQYRATRRKKYTSAQKRSVVMAVEQGMTIQQAQIAFGLSTSNLVRTWVAEVKKKNDDLREPKALVMTKKAHLKTDPQVQQLQKELAQAQLKIKALDILIDIAEEQLHIDIRKKSGARQSSK